MSGLSRQERIQSSAAPGRVAVVLDRLAGAEASLGVRGMDALVAVAGASDSLGDLLAEDGDALPVLDDLEQPVVLDAGTPESLARTYRLGLLRIAARDLLGNDDLAATVAALSSLAAEVVESSLGLAEADDIAVIGMGKFGAGELNFVSDVDLLLLSCGDPEQDERAARRFLQVAGRCFRVDTTLRPQGRDGPLVRSLDSYQAYWERWAEAWEFQALLKARAVAGPDGAGDAFAQAAAAALWERPFGAEDLRQIRRLKARTENELEARGLDEREVKRGRGGIRDIEFSAQLLQLVHGGADPLLRTAATLPALRHLESGGYVAADEAETLRQAYVFLRRVEHRLQLVQERQTHTVPADRAKRRRIARALGYRGVAEGGPTERFDDDLRRHRLAVRRVHESWYFRPLLDAFAGAGTLSAAISTARLEAFGFREVTRTRQAVQELASGLTRSSRLMRQLLPLVLDWLSDGPDPDLGLLGLRRLASGEQRTMRLVTAFRDSAETARRLCDLLTLAPVATEILLANPDLVERLDDAARLQTRHRDDLLVSVWQAVGWRDGEDEQRGALFRWYRRHLLGIVARDVAGEADAAVVGADLAALAEAVLETAVRLAAPAVPLAVIGMGRLGAAELSYGSDVDVVFVHAGSGSEDAAEAERAAAAVRRLVHGTTPASRVLVLDTDLRPEGRQGPLARSLDSYAAYLDRWAEVWERQALLRARPVAGDPGVGRAFAELVGQVLWSQPPSEEDEREIRRMKARVEAERIPRGVDRQRHLKLGPGGLADVEWTAQLLQWRHGVRDRSTVTALHRLQEHGALRADDVAVLEDAHRFCDQLRNRAWLVFGNGDVLPERAEALATLARAVSMGAGSIDGGPPGMPVVATSAELVEEYRRRMRRSRRVVEALFYSPG